MTNEDAIAEVATDIQEIRRGIHGHFSAETVVNDLDARRLRLLRKLLRSAYSIAYRCDADDLREEADNLRDIADACEDLAEEIDE